MSNVLCWTSPGVIGFDSIPYNSLAPKQIRVKTLISRLRHGPDLNRSARFRRPSFPYYMAAWGVAEIIEVGESVTDSTPGDRVYGPMLHADTQVVEVESVVPLSRFSNRKEFSTFIDAGMMALQLVHSSGIRFGDRIAVLGMGTIGLMALQYAWMSGAREIVAIDPLSSRLSVAQNLGAHRIVPQLSDQNSNLNAIIDCSGSSGALREAIRFAPLNCKVVADIDSIDPESIEELYEFARQRDILFQSLTTDSAPDDLRDRVLYSIVNKLVVVWPIISHYVPFRESPAICSQIQNEPNKYIQVLFTYDE